MTPLVSIRRTTSRSTTQRRSGAASLVFSLVAGLLLPAAALAIPATRVMTVYQFNGPASVPYYEAARFGSSGPGPSAGTLLQGTSVIPCVLLRNGRPLTDSSGTPYVGFEVVVDPRRATAEAADRFTEAVRGRKEMTVEDHRCPASVRHVIDVRKIFALETGPRFDPPRSAGREVPPVRAASELDAIVRAFHASPQCEEANRRLVGRRESLARAWDAFADEASGRWSAAAVKQARQLDYVMRTALYEGHLDRGCNAYGACERNVIALSIRNRGLERCLRGQGCRFPGDFEGVASTVSQYNIWDEYLTQSSGLTACYLRPDLAGNERYVRLQAMYAQSVGDVSRILFGGDDGLRSVFSGPGASSATELRHYYHPPAMGKCFPNQDRLEYISGAIAERDGRLALIADTRIVVGERVGSGYRFRQAVIDTKGPRDKIDVVDRYPGFVIDGRKVELRKPSSCPPYGTPRGCRFESVGRYRKTPSWVDSGDPIQLTCKVRARGEDCRSEPVVATAKVGGVCDVEMQPIAGVP